MISFCMNRTFLFLLKTSYDLFSTDLNIMIVTQNSNSLLPFWHCLRHHYLVYMKECGKKLFLKTRRYFSSSFKPIRQSHFETQRFIWLKGTTEKKTLKIFLLDSNQTKIQRKSQQPLHHQVFVVLIVDIWMKPDLFHDTKRQMIPKNLFKIHRRFVVLTVDIWLYPELFSATKRQRSKRWPRHHNIPRRWWTCSFQLWKRRDNSPSFWI